MSHAREAEEASKEAERVRRCVTCGGACRRSAAVRPWASIGLAACMGLRHGWGGGAVHACQLFT